MATGVILKLSSLSCLVMLLWSCMGLSFLINQNLMTIELLTEPSLSSPELARSESAFIPTMAALDKTVSQPDERSKLQSRLLSSHHHNGLQSRPLKVFVFPFHLKNLVYGEGKHFILDGLMHSEHFHLIHNMSHSSDADVWVGNFRIGYRPRYWCNVLEKFYSRTALTPMKRPPIFLLDWSDHPNLDACRNLTNLSTRVHYSKRSIVKNRDFVEDWVEVGEIDSFLSWRQFASSPVQNLPYAVRSDLVETMESFLRQEQNESSTNNSRKGYVTEFDIVNRKRTIDVAHFWPSPPGVVPYQDGGKKQGVDRGGKLHNNAKLRDTVSLVLDHLQNATETRTINSFTGLSGTADGKGREYVQREYAKDLLDSKIVVVTQRDHWEGSYRLMEALVSGACVLTDTMLSIPPDYKDGVNIIFYDSPESLKSQVLYYLERTKERLEIAQRGLDTSMNRHRSWHLMEEVVFGRALGKRNQSYPSRVL